LAKRAKAKAKPKAKERGPVLVKKNGERRQMATALEKIQKLQEQIEEAKTEALEELRAKRREIQALLTDIDSQISELGGGSSRQGKSKGTRKSSSEATCKICGITGHDARAHRSQGKNKRKFSAEELREKGYTS